MQGHVKLAMTQKMEMHGEAVGSGPSLQVNDKVFVGEEKETACVVKDLGNGNYAVDYRDGHVSYEEVGGDQLQGTGQKCTSSPPQGSGDGGDGNPGDGVNGGDDGDGAHGGGGGTFKVHDQVAVGEEKE